MKLTELNPQFYRYDRRMTEVEMCIGDSQTWRERGCPTEKRTEPRDWRIPVETLIDAQCIMFICPKCFIPNGGAHYVEVTFADRGVLPGMGIHNSKGEDVRWKVSGTGYGDLTTQPSILIEGGCQWHGFITKGEIK